MVFSRLSAITRIGAIALAALTLAACEESSIPKEVRPVSYRLVDKMRSMGMEKTSPILIRIFKEESALEVWKQRRDGQYGLLKTYSICKWSGNLGPKVKEGDRQAPEGFYIVTPAQMNPNSSYYLSFNIGYPNAFDRSYGRTGSNLMVHGACSSSGCYSMTDADAGELFGLARDAFQGGQTSFQIQAFPFRMTPENLARHRDDPNMDFWRMLKVGYDHFEVTRRVPKVDVCAKRYVFDAEAGGAKFVATAKCPAYKIPPEIEAAVAAKQAADDKKFDAAVAKLQADASVAAEKQRKAQEAAAAKAEADAKAAAQPPLLTRWFGRGSRKAAAPPAPTGADASAATPISTTVPPPRVRPATKPIVEANATSDPVAPPKPKKKTPAAAVATAAPAKPKPAPAKPPAPVATADTPQSSGDGMEAFPETADNSAPAAATAAAPPAGKLVKRDFFWADEPTTDGGAGILKPSLSKPAE